MHLSAPSLLSRSLAGILLLAACLTGLVIPDDLLAAMIVSAPVSAEDSEQKTEDSLAERSHASRDHSLHRGQPALNSLARVPAWPGRLRPDGVAPRLGLARSCEHAWRNGLGAPLVC